MAVIRRTIKWWSTTTGTSNHLGIEIDTEADLHIKIGEGTEVEDIKNAALIVDTILNMIMKAKYPSRKGDPDGGQRTEEHGTS